VADPRETARKLIALATNDAAELPEAYAAALAACRLIVKHDLLARSHVEAQDFLEAFRTYGEKVKAQPRGRAHGFGGSATPRRETTTTAQPVETKGKVFVFEDATALEEEDGRMFKVMFYDRVNRHDTYEYVPSREFLRVQQRDDGSAERYVTRVGVKMRYAMHLGLRDRAGGTVEDE
jgi:hypothetical protein